MAPDYTRKPKANCMFDIESELNVISTKVWQNVVVSLPLETII